MDQYLKIVGSKSFIFVFIQLLTNKFVDAVLNVMLAVGQKHMRCISCVTDVLCDRASYHSDEHSPHHYAPTRRDYLCIINLVSQCQLC